jgi:hypothetical protein
MESILAIAGHLAWLLILDESVSGVPLVGPHLAAIHANNDGPACQRLGCSASIAASSTGHITSGGKWSMTGGIAVVQRNPARERKSNDDVKRS